MRSSGSELSSGRASAAASGSSLASSCRICLAALRRPAALACGHRFCERCLARYWRAGDKPACLVCPLCRACAYDVNFTKQDKKPSSDDFRRMFTPIMVKELDVQRAVLWYIKISALMPAIYFLLKWLKPPMLQLFKTFYLTVASKK